jgi:phosphonopyruvate decarboxylase
MINPKFLLDELVRLGITFFTGVPDSLMKNFLLFLDSQSDQVIHVPAANEGGAIGLAAGHYLSTRKCPLVYMQNSGLGNALNPLVSLADREVYSIPLLILIGWRGEPGTSDEPQHVKQGRITLDLLRVLEIPYEILPAEEEDAGKIIERSYNSAVKMSAPAALIAKKSVFSGAPSGDSPEPRYTLSRESALAQVIGALEKDAMFVSTTGKLSRELYEYRSHSGGACCDFITVGSMGHVSQIALGVALGRSDRPVYCLDGDGSSIMHLGGLTVAGTSGLENFKHVIFNNGVHDSVGGQSTRGFSVDLLAVARAMNYRSAFYADNEAQLRQELGNLKRAKGPAILEIRIKPGARKDLGRPKEAMTEIKERFMNQM